MKMRVVKKQLKRKGLFLYSFAYNGSIRYGFGNEQQEICCPAPRREFIKFIKDNLYYIK